MRHKIYFPFLLSIYLTNCGGLPLNEDDLLHSILELQNISRTTVEKWQHNLVIPSYMQDILHSIPQNVTSRELQQSPWFEGVRDVCKFQVVDWLLRLQPQHWEQTFDEKDKWVLQMIDAWGKIPEGVLSGHTASYGDFDECIETEAYLDELAIPMDDSSLTPSFTGLYCTSYLIPSITPEQTRNANNFTIQESLSLRELLKSMMGITPAFLPPIPSIGTCHPNTCTQSDVQSLLTNGINQLLQNSNISVTPLTIDCTDKHKPPLNGGTITMIIILAALVGIAVVAGVLDYFDTHYTKESERLSGKSYQYLKAFSIYTNTKKLLGTRRSAEDLGCLHGIRFLSTAWVVLGHTYAMFMQGPQWNQVDINNLFKNWTEMAVLNATFSVDTFFVMSGMLATYNILKVLEKSRGRLNVPMLYIHRYLRLTPTYAILIGISATLLKYTGNGPTWWYFTYADKYCQDNWWTNILYINNIVHSDEMCNAESWYLANDMQFFILAPLILYPLWKWEMVGIIMLIIYTILSCVAPVLVVRYKHSLPGAFFTRPELMAGFADIYLRPWSRISTFLVGVWLGWILHKTRGKQVALPKFVVALLWLANTGVALALIFGVKDWFDPANSIPTVAGYFYAGLSRFSWAVVVSWIIFACLKGYGGLINEFLSWRAFMPLGRLCFCVYLTSFHLQGMFHAKLTVPIKWDTYTVVNLFFAHMVMSYFVGFLCTLLFESPFMVLQKLVFEGKAKTKKPAEILPKDQEPKC